MWEQVIIVDSVHITDASFSSFKLISAQNISKHLTSLLCLESTSIVCIQMSLESALWIIIASSYGLKTDGEKMAEPTTLKSNGKKQRAQGNVSHYF